MEQHFEAEVWKEISEWAKTMGYSLIEIQEKKVDLIHEWWNLRLFPN